MTVCSKFSVRYSSFDIPTFSIFIISFLAKSHIHALHHAPCTRRLAPDRPFLNIEWWTAECRMLNDCLFEIRRSKFIIRHSHLFNIHHFLSCQITPSRPAPCTRRLAPDRSFLNVEWWTAEYRMSNDICSKFDVRNSSFVIPTCSIFIISFLAKSHIHALHPEPGALLQTGLF